MKGHRKRLAAQRGARVGVLLLAAATLSGCAIGCWFVPCDQALLVRTSVHDPTGVPLAGVHVQVLDRTGETDANGCLELGGVANVRTISLRAEAPGYKPYSDARSYGTYSIDVVLAPESAAERSAATWKPRGASDASCARATGRP
jgi:hypothetical protein